MSIWEMFALAAAAAAAGAINAVAGGGTILAFPTLLFFGVPPIQANATCTLALFLGTSGSIFGFRGHIHSVRTFLPRLVPASVIGGWLGGIALTHTGDKSFASLVPFLLLFATALFMAQTVFRRFATASVTRHFQAPVAAVVFQFVVAFYGGYFGAGIGILMLASLGFMGFHDIHEMNALKNVLASMINLVASLWFIYSGFIDWPRAAVLTIGAIAGYFCGAHFSQRIPQVLVRRFISGIGLCLSLYLLWDAWRSGLLRPA